MKIVLSSLLLIGYFAVSSASNAQSSYTLNPELIRQNMKVDLYSKILFITYDGKEVARCKSSSLSKLLVDRGYSNDHQLNLAKLSGSNIRLNTQNCVMAIAN